MENSGSHGGLAWGWGVAVTPGWGLFGELGLLGGERGVAKEKLLIDRRWYRQEEVERPLISVGQRSFFEVKGEVRLALHATHTKAPPHVAFLTWMVTSQCRLHWDGDHQGSKLDTKELAASRPGSRSSCVQSGGKKDVSQPSPNSPDSESLLPVMVPRSASGWR